MPGISAVIPAYNEEYTIAQAVSEVDAALAGLGLDYEIVVVNDGSRDGTQRVLDELSPRYPALRVVLHEVNRGYGGALRSGFSAAQKDLIFLTPGDNQFVPTEVSLLLEHVNEADLVVGYRLHRQDTLPRRLNGWGWNFLIRLFFGKVARDVDCGFKLFWRRVLERVPLTSSGAMVDTELLVGSARRGLKIVEVPVTHRERVEGKATGAKLRVILRAFRDLWRYRSRLQRELSAERAAR